MMRERSSRPRKAAASSRNCGPSASSSAVHGGLRGDTKDDIASIQATTRVKGGVHAKERVQRLNAEDGQVYSKDQPS